nr:uncharacterized protein LOC101119153 isoform X1 [Ovis aries]
MITEFLSLLCLGLCLGNEDEENNGNQKESKPTPEKTDTRIVFGATFSCLSLFLLFLAVFFIYRCTQQDSSEEESIKRTCHSKVHKQRDADVPMLERISESDGGVTKGYTTSVYHITMLLLLLSHLSRVRLRATPWTAAHQAPPSLGSSRQEHWSGLSLPFPHEHEYTLKLHRVIYQLHLKQTNKTTGALNFTVAGFQLPMATIYYHVV